MNGGAGNDTFVVDNIGDTASEAADSGYDSVLSSISFTLGANVEELWLQGTASINGTGNALDNHITGNSGNNVLSGGGGADLMQGQNGNDTYIVDNIGDVVDEDGWDGTDLVKSSVSFELTSVFVENLTLTGTAAIDGTGNSWANVLIGNSASNVLSGGGGDDRLNGGAGRDTLIGGEGADTFVGTKADLNGDVILDLGAGDRIVISDASLAGFSASLSGSTLSFTGGSLSLAVPIGTTVVASAASEGGVQLQLAAASNLHFQAFAAFDINSVNLNWYNQFATGSSLQKGVNVSFHGHTYADAFGVQASDGVDFRELDFLGSGITQNVSGAITGGTVNVVGEFNAFDASPLWVAEGASLSAVSLYNAALTASNADELALIAQALAGNDTILLSDFNDRMSGYAGNDQINGGGGQDILSGSTGDDVLEGGAGDDSLDGGDGVDTATYQEALAGVTVTLGTTAAQATGGAGTDSLIRIENLTGSLFDDVLTGNSGANSLVGQDGNDVLDGGAGADTMSGGMGDDMFVVRDAGDVVIEKAGQGIDTIRSSISLTLGANVENLTLSGTADLAGTGNDLANVIVGNSGANVLRGLGGNDSLDGGAGIDKMYGGAGNDTFYTGAGDTVTELAGEGTDLVISSVDATLRANVENLTLGGSANIYGRGNELANLIVGNGGANRLFGLDGDDTLNGSGGNDRLDGGAGTDKLYGGSGSDTYVVSEATDRVFENAGEGTDSVLASVSYKLADNIEKLTLTGSSDSYGYGNDLANVLTGNVGANRLYGVEGNDTISGGAGDDLLYGGIGTDTLKGGDGNDWVEGGADRDVLYGNAGADTFAFRDGDFGGATTSTADRIADFSQADGDRIRLSYVDANSANGNATNEAFHFIGTNVFSHNAGELRYQEISGDTYVSGDTNGDGVADFMIRLDGSHALTASDFVL